MTILHFLDSCMKLLFHLHPIFLICKKLINLIFQKFYALLIKLVSDDIIESLPFFLLPCLDVFSKKLSVALPLRELFLPFNFLDWLPLTEETSLNIGDPTWNPRVPGPLRPEFLAV